MRAVVVFFDSLNRKFLPPYGADWIQAPNFTRLASRSVTFDNCYAGSMPCMPARRELHTGRYNFLHRSWGPLEPFDDSMPEMLKKAGTYTHLVTDHQHYWEDGGATYHNRYNTYELIRGQEGDAWKGQVSDGLLPDNPRLTLRSHWRQDWINRQYLATKDLHPQTKVFDAGLEFMETNLADDNWLVQIECFDPHEPFYSFAEHKTLYPDGYDGPPLDWPEYKRTTEPEETVEHVRNEYAALLSMCDESLGRVLNFMDTHEMWDDTMLIVCTDHGFLLGEHGWWGKTVQPWFDETIHTPLFMWDPRTGVAGERRDALVQTIDLGPTLLDFFGVEPTERMEGKPLGNVLEDDRPVRESALFGSFGSHVNVTDGRYVYMRASASARNEPLFEHTLMPTHMHSLFAPEELRNAQLHEPLSFTRGAPVLKIPALSFGNPYAFGTMLFDLQADPGQDYSLIDDELELRMIGQMLDLMRMNSAPDSQYERLGLPKTGPPDRSHLQLARHFAQYEAAKEPLPDPADFRVGSPGVNSTLGNLVDNAYARSVLREALGHTLDQLLVFGNELTLVDLACFTPSLSRAVLNELDRKLASNELPPTTVGARNTERSQNDL